MPRPRFSKLDSETRERILLAAALEFAERGFEEASINNVIERAEISKGAMYYYFDDKEDLFGAVAAYFFDCSQGLASINMESLTRETFWATIDQYACNMLGFMQRNRWAMRFIRTFKDLSRRPQVPAAVRDGFQRLREAQAALLHRGQALGLLRTDIPDAFLLGLLDALDQAKDQYVAAVWEQMSQEEQQRFIRTMLDLHRRLLVPAEPTNHEGL